MVQVASDQMLARRGILNYFHSGTSRGDARTYLLKSHQSCPLIFPKVDYRDVDFWYKSFGEGNYDLNQIPIYPVLTKLESLPVLGHVIHLLDVKDQLSMRRVCRTFKFFIDAENRTFLSVKFVVLATGSAMLKTRNVTEEAKTCFNRQTKGCNVLTPCDKNFIQEGLDAFKKTVKTRHTKVGKMHILYNSTDKSKCEECRHHFISGITSVFKDLPQKSHVQYLKLTVDFPNELDAILSRIRSESFVALDLKCSNETVFNISEVASFFAHLPNLDRLTIDSYIDIEMACFVHIPHLTVNVNSITPQEFFAYKNNLLQQPKIEKQTICCNAINHVYHDKGMWKNALQPCIIEYEQGDFFTGSCLIPGNTESLLVFEIWVEFGIGWFGRISIKFEKKTFQERTLQISTI